MAVKAACVLEVWASLSLGEQGTAGMGLCVMGFDDSRYFLRFVGFGVLGF